jgi:glyoxylase-like metal-dependent hydrolase (beta-lactamase superfamily II)
MGQIKTMNLLESALDYPLGETMPSIGAALNVVQGETGVSAIQWVRMSLPFALNHINLWLLRDEMEGRKGWCVVDCCISHEKSKAQWEDIFANELEGLPILRVLVTHMHPDHIGLAHWLCQRWSATLWISATDYHVARIACQGPNGFGGERAAAYFGTHGLDDPDALREIQARTAYFPALVPSVPPQFRRLMDDMQLRIGGRGWRCISGYGHAPEHISLYCDSLGVLIAGDMVLPRISTNVSVYEAEPDADALALFLDSIDKFRSLPADTLVLPSHGKPFRGLHTRIDQLHDHHHARLSEVMDACARTPCSAANIVPVLFERTMDLHQTTFAMGEAVAHLNYLWHAGKLRRFTDDDGVLRFTPKDSMQQQGTCCE